MMPCFPDKMFRFLSGLALALTLSAVLLGANSGCSLTKTQLVTDGSSIKEEKSLKLRRDFATSESTSQHSTTDAPVD